MPAAVEYRGAAVGEHGENRRSEKETGGDEVKATAAARQVLPLPDLPIWLEVRDGDPAARALFHRHYSYKPYRDGRRPKLFCGPGEKMILLSRDGRALFVWRKFQSADGQPGVNCAVFRNESEIRSSELILEAERLAWRRWPGERLYTYVNARKIRSSNPGYCFKCAGWRTCGMTRWNQLVILEKLPEEEGDPPCPTPTT